MNNNFKDESLNIPADNPIHQKIDVEASFFARNKKQKNAPCIPRSFRTESGREVMISEIGLIHPKYNGIKTLFLFDITDGASDYRISFDTETLEWFLEWEGDQYV